MFPKWQRNYSRKERTQRHLPTKKTATTMRFREVLLFLCSCFNYCFVQCCLDEHSERIRFQVNCPVGFSWHFRHCSTHTFLPAHHFYRGTWYAPVTSPILLQLMCVTKAWDIILIHKYLLIRATLVCLLMSCGILKQFHAENTGAPLTKILPLPSWKYWAILQSTQFFYIVYFNNYFLLQAD
jgi:hypothetical protein